MVEAELGVHELLDLILAIPIGRASINLSLESVDLGGLLKLFEQFKELGSYKIIVNLTYFDLFKANRRFNIN